MGLGSLSSTRTNKPSRASPTASGTSTATEPQPYEDAAISPYVIPASAPLMQAAPFQSSLGTGPGALVSGTCRAEMATTSTATGKLMKNTSRQDTASISHPPRNGPNAVATPPSPDHAPIAAIRSSSANEACRMARLPGVSSAPPTPCSARAAIRTPMPGATPHSSDASANHTVPTTNIFRRP